jgi:hypothetical protein
MNNIALITDQHFQARKNSKEFHEYFLQFYENIFFPYLIENNIKTVIDLGDTFDNRNYLDPTAIDWAKRHYYNRLLELGIDHHVIVGNHTAKLKNTNRISSVDLILREYSNITVYSEPTEVVIQGLKILFIPWINKENENQTLELIESTDANIAMGHLELNGFTPYKGRVMEDGRSSDPFNKFEKVFSGHFHTRSDNGKIYYIGNPYELYFNDLDDERGFAIFDPETLDHHYINNPFRMHYQLTYDDDLNQIPTSGFEGKIIKLVARKITDFKKFESFIECLNNQQPMEVKIIQAAEVVESEQFETVDTEDTLSILQRFVDESEIEYDKERVKSIIGSIYQEVMQEV